MTASKRLTRDRKLEWIPLGRTRVNPAGQRKFRPAWAALILSELDLNRIGTPEVNLRDGYYYIKDGQHRIQVLKDFCGEGWEDQTLQCWVTEGLTEAEEADEFIVLNKRKQINVFDLFRSAITAGYPDEIQVAAQVEALGMTVTNQKTPNSVYCVSTLLKILRRSDAATLRRTLRIARDSYGDSGMRTNTLDGLALLCQRYGDRVSDKVLIERLSTARGGINGLTGNARLLKEKYQEPMAQCVAAAAVTMYNRGRTGKKRLVKWFK